jgi:O-methyltransferase involved in polyketide biosynthesis
MAEVPADRDFSTISAAARTLLMVKAQTGLPYARAAAELLWGARAVEESVEQIAKNPAMVLRRRHFELRARSLDALLDALPDGAASRVLEVAAGLSFRGAERAERAGVFYVDSDLPGIVETKASLLERLHPEPLAGTLRLRALDALDPVAFGAAVAELPTGPIAIVHEGLLMYLDDAEKARLAANVRAALLERGGWWTTADVYVRGGSMFREEKTKKFLEEHRVDERKFADWASARAFFEGAGFTVARTVAPSSSPDRIRETWLLKARE